MNIMNGCEIWMEHIAKYYAMQIALKFNYYNFIYDYVEQMEEIIKNIRVRDTLVKYCLSFWLAEIMDTKEARNDGWYSIEKMQIEIDFPFVSLTKQIYEYMQIAAFYKITPGFICELGVSYLDGILNY